MRRWRWENEWGLYGMPEVWACLEAHDYDRARAAWQLGCARLVLVRRVRRQLAGWSKREQRRGGAGRA